MKVSVILANLMLAAAAVQALIPQQQSNQHHSQSSVVDSRRSMLQKAGALVAGGAFLGLEPKAAFASGGATAGKYTTIPIAKRRYYGRVQAAVHDFLLLGPEVVKGDMSSASIKKFFDVNALVVVEARSQSINGQCTKKDSSCKGQEVRDSPYNDMKTSMYLLGNAFRINQQKPPDVLPSVKAAKAFFKEMDAMEKRVKKGKEGDKEAIGHYAAALEILDTYLDLVELPPIDSNWYEQEFSRQVGVSSRIM
ncbi:unnamed protein product [Cylindrotheca closterium]|uniref:Uncharacterized protein n=1 Tax=Cylindrotheca closterium TaxID=2856 RepID=A0AAD2JKX0_9STRA|nr:unnamed protein product [Cylindrotheca closterium]